MELMGKQEAYSKNTIYALMTMTTFFWAGAFIAAKLGVYALSPAILTFLRMGVAALILFPILLLKEKSTWRLAPGDWKHILGTAIIGMIGYHMFFFTAMSYTTATKASMINGMNPLITAVLAALFAGETLGWKKAVMLLIALAGVVNIVIGGNFATLLEFQFNKGDLFMLCGTLMWAIYGILVKRAMPRMGPLKLTSYTFLVSSVLISPFAIYDFMHTDALHAGAGPYLAVLYMAIFPTVIGYTIQQMAIARIGPSKASLFINLVPVISTVLAVLFLKETIETYHIVGAAMIIGAVIGYNRM
jgi:drug/metabolite transporter (DMT)-like permease